MSNIGMMDAAFFVDRNTLLSWLNDLLGLGYTKVEQCCSGAAYAQILDSIYPGKVALRKVNFNAKYEYEYVKNFKVIQDCFIKMGVDKHLEVEKLIKGKYQDNLELLQWMKRYFDLNFPGGEYDAAGRRGGTAKPNPIAAPAPGTKKPAAAARQPAAATRQPAAAPAARAAPAAASRPAAGGGAKSRELQEEVTQLKLTVDNIEKERDFYFGKLREIEILCQTTEDLEPAAEEFKQKILAILYATDEEEGGE